MNNDREVIIAFAKEQMEKWDLISKGWIFKFNNRKGSFGLCSYRKKTLSLSLFLFNTISMEKKKDTVLHEIAHALDKEWNGVSSGHDRPWKIVCLQVGAEPTKCSSATNQEEVARLARQSKYSLTCPNGHVRPSHRKLKRTVSCEKCDPNAFNSEYVYEQIQNY